MMMMIIIIIIIDDDDDDDGDVLTVTHKVELFFHENVDHIGSYSTFSVVGKVFPPMM